MIVITIWDIIVLIILSIAIIILLGSLFYQNLKNGKTKERNKTMRRMQIF